MTPQAFQDWLAEMKSAGLAKTQAECAQLLGVTPNGIMKMKRNGTPQSTALACAALLHRLKPYDGR